MPRRYKGYSAYPYKEKASGKWYGRLELKKPDGKMKVYSRQARNKTHARQIADELEARYITGGTEALDAENMTVGELAGRYRKAKVVDAAYDGGIKVSGMIAKASAEDEIKELLEYWNLAPIQKITHAAIEEYKSHILKKPTFWRWRKGDKIVEKPRGTPRKMSSVNHLLRRLRAMLNFAIRNGWLVKNPFNAGEPLISDAAEVPRNRAERVEELDKLLAACVGSRAYLRPVILIMADSALRLTEAKRLTRANLDLDRKVAYIEARNTKKNKQLRIIPLSDRLIEELKVWAEKAKTDDVPILQQGDYKKAWKALKKEAKISDDLQLRDLRGWGTSKIARALAANNLPWQWGMKATGHTQTKTYERYLKTDEEIARQTGEALKKIEKKVA
jgi:integrase